MRSQTRRALVLNAWRARDRARRAATVLEQSRAWMQMFLALRAARRLPRTLEGA